MYSISTTYLYNVTMEHCFELTPVMQQAIGPTLGTLGAQVSDYVSLGHHENCVWHHPAACRTGGGYCHGVTTPARRDDGSECANSPPEDCVTQSGVGSLLTVAEKTNLLQTIKPLVPGTLYTIEPIGYEVSRWCDL